MDFNPFKNIVVNIKATGAAAILIVWCISVTLLGLFGQGEMAVRAFNLLAFFGGVTLFALSVKA
ncbi:hypothetical protein [Oceanimonas smirnovii]|uniref:hypothetical protein n=1 Tax=Oceanimonas smirnovii TaxID=264574 RepID=UPI003FD42EF1